MQGVCDKSCIGCVFLYRYGESINYVCEYMLQTETRRPCPAGKGCTVRATKRGRTMAQVIAADAYSYLARKEAQDKLSAEMQQCSRDGLGASYGVWKAAQPVQAVDQPEIPDGWKVCPFCGEKFKPKMPYAVYCCTEHQRLAYQRSVRDKRNAYQAKLRTKRKAEKVEAEK